MQRTKVVLLVTGIVMLALGTCPRPGLADENATPPLPQIEITAEGALDFLSFDGDAIYQAAWQAHSDKDYETAAKYYIAMLNHDTRNQTALYNLGCCYSMLGKAGPAAECLLAAADAGFSNLWSLDHDPEFDPIRETPEYTAAVEDLTAAIEEQQLKQGEMFFVKATGYLPCHLQFPDDYDPHKAYILLVGLHGYGSYPTRFINLWDRFAEHDFIYAVPQAPYPFNSGMDEPGFSWGWWTDTHGLPQNSWDLSADYLAALIDQLQNTCKVSDTYVLGFSQGAAMSYYVGMRNPGSISGIIPFGGWLDVPGIGESLIADAAGRLRVFIVHGNEDTMVNFSDGQDALAKLEQLGYDVTFLEFDGGHQVPQEQLQAAEVWMKNPPVKDTPE
jgi:phospholipase/carboxylesterase